MPKRILLAYIINLAEIAMHHIGRSSNNNNRSINWRQSTIQSRLNTNSSVRHQQHYHHHHSRNESSPLMKVMTSNENNSLLSVPSYSTPTTTTVPVTHIDVTQTEEIMDFPPTTTDASSSALTNASPATTNNLFKFS